MHVHRGVCRRRPAARRRRRRREGGRRWAGAGAPHGWVPHPGPQLRGEALTARSRRSQCTCTHSTSTASQASDVPGAVCSTTFRLLHHIPPHSNASSTTFHRLLHHISPFHLNHLSLWHRRAPTRGRLAPRRWSTRARRWASAAAPGTAAGAYTRPLFGLT
jgi:hypothetical protein